MTEKNRNRILELADERNMCQIDGADNLIAYIITLMIIKSDKGYVEGYDEGYDEGHDTACREGHGG